MTAKYHAQRSVYVGEHRAGHLVLRDGEFISFDHLGRVLGRHQTAAEAVAAVLKAGGAA
jgi:hypothetical protein